MIRAVLFDLDGVLVETYEAWFSLLKAAVAELGYPDISRERFHSMWGQGIQADIDTIFTRHTVAEIERYYDDHFGDHAGRVQVNPDAGPVFAALRAAGKSTAVITNTPAPLARVILGQARLAPQALVGGTDVPRSKPAPDMVWRACEMLVVDPSEAVVVGDSRFDREAAAAAGARFVGYRLAGDETLENLRGILSAVEGR